MAACLSGSAEKSIDCLSTCANGEEMAGVFVRRACSGLVSGSIYV